MNQFLLLKLKKFINYNDVNIKIKDTRVGPPYGPVSIRKNYINLLSVLVNFKVFCLL